MQTKIEKTFPIDASADTAWRLLADMAAVAECMPGAQITEKIDASHYKGQVRVKLGPAAAAFAGTIEVLATDPAQRRIQLRGKGTDAKGGSAASMDLTAEVRGAAGNRSELIGRAEVTLTGKLASFGGRMINQVSDQILKQFGQNFAGRVQSMGGDSGPPTGGTEGTTAPPAASASPRANELNVLSLLWSVIADFFRKLFGRGEKTDTPN
jgi:uncharacterized protein